MQNAVMLGFNETTSDGHLKNLLEQTNFPDNCKVAQAKLVNPMIFSTVSSCSQEHWHKIQVHQKGLF